MNNVDLYLKEERKRRRFTRGFVFTLAGSSLLILVALGAFYVVDHAPFFAVRAITVRGAEHIDRDRVRAAAISHVSRSFLMDILGPGSMLSWNAALGTSVKALLPEAATVAFRKDYGSHEIEVSIVERQPFGIWCFERGKAGTSLPPCYWFDETGTVFKKTPVAEGSVIPIIHDYAQENVGIGNTVLPPGFVPALFSILRVLKTAQLSTLEVRINDLSSEEVHATTYSGLRLYFSLRFPADSTLGALQSLTRKTADTRPLEYIDLRVENRVYYK